MQLAEFLTYLTEYDCGSDWTKAFNLREQSLLKAKSQHTGYWHQIDTVYITPKQLLMERDGDNIQTYNLHKDLNIVGIAIFDRSFIN